MNNRIRFIVFFIILFGMVSDIHAAHSERMSSISIGNIDYIHLEELAKLYHLSEQWNPTTHNITLERKDIILSFRPGSLYAALNGKIKKMPDIARIVNGKLAIPLSFGLEHLNQLTLSKKTQTKPKTNIVPKHRQFRLVLDAGHGGNDPGAIGKKGAKEKNITLDICKRILKQLEGTGIKVTLTRRSDKFVTLWRRNYISRKIGPDLFISIHANSSRNKKVYGIETYYPKTLSSKNNGKHYKKNKYLSYYFSRIVQNNLCKQLVAKNRGVKKANFFVLKNAYCPATLIETGFLSHHWEERKLNNSSYREKVAHAIVKSILAYKRKVGK